MAVASITKTVARASWLLDARADGSAFNDTIADDRYIQEEFQRSAIETEAEIARALAESYHPKRIVLAWSNDLAHGDTVPEHIGQIEAVQIELYTGAGVYSPAEETSRENIRLWRENHETIFDALAHNVNGSALSGYFNLTNQTIRFTGAQAQVKVCTFAPDYVTPAHQISDEFESAIIAGMIPKLHKQGTAESVIAHFSREYDRIMTAIRQGHGQMPDINVAQKVS